MLKFATFQVLSATLAPTGQSRRAMRKWAHRHHFQYEPRPGYLYVRSRAISSRCNDNFDEFPAAEIKKSFATFVGKPVFVNHHNDNHRRARGVIIDAALHEDTLPDGAPDTWAEVLMEVDAVKFPKLAKAILAGHIDRTSMGTDVAFSVCSVCNNKATNPTEYCAHIPKMKGQRIYRTTASGSKEGVLVREICHGLKFFENSLLVEEPADPTAFFTGVDDHSKTASRKTAVSDEDRARWALMEEEHRARYAQEAEMRSKGICDCPGSLRIEQHRMDDHSSWATQKHEEGKTDPWGHPYMQPYDGHGAFACNNGSCAEHPQEMYQDGQGMPGWMQHDLDPNKALTREVNKSFYDAGQQEDGRYLLDQQTQGPSKHSRKVAHSGHDGPEKGPLHDGDDYHTMHRHDGEQTYLAGLGCPHCDDGFFNPDAREQHIKDQHPGEYAGPSADMMMLQEIQKQRQDEEDARESGQAHPAHHIPDDDIEALHHHLVNSDDHVAGWGYGYIGDHAGFGEEDAYRRSQVKAMHDAAHERMEDENPMGRYGEHNGSYHWHVPPQEHGLADYRRNVEMDPPHHKPEHDLGSHADTSLHLVLDHGHDMDEADDLISAADRHAELHRNHDEWPDEYPMTPHSHTPPAAPGQRQGAKQAKERKPIKDMSPEELTEFRRHQERGKAWNRKHKPHADNVIEHWNAATHSERHTGMNWYRDAHEMTKHIAQDTGTDLSVAAGLMSNYSPQTHWAANIMRAAQVMRTKKGIGGKGSGVMATDGQRNAANRMLGAEGHEKEHYEKVLAGPKTKAFARLIHHGKSADDSNPDVVIDRHALSVACGARASDMAYEQSRLGTKGRYDEVSKVYHQAAKHISRETGVKVDAHQVQAATWLVRQRLNSAENARMASHAERGRNAKAQWDEYAGEHHPHVMGKEPGTGYSNVNDRSYKDRLRSLPDDVKHAVEMSAEGHGESEALHSPVKHTNPRRKPRLMHESSRAVLAYGDTVAPVEVNTLRDDACPVCGEAEAYDGQDCQVCGFVAPPDMFQDPDLDAAKNYDLREDKEDALNATDGDPNGDGMPDMIPGQTPMDPSQITDPMDPAQQQMGLDPNGTAPEQMENRPGDGVPDLMCENCGFSADSTPPQSVNMAQPMDHPDGLVSGDVCPTCQQGVLLTQEEIEQIEQMKQMEMAQQGQAPVQQSQTPM